VVSPSDEPRRAVPVGNDGRPRFARVRMQQVVASAAIALVAQGSAATERRVDVTPPANLVAGDPALLADSPGARGDRVLRVALVFDYTRAPLVLIAQSQTAYRVVQEQLWAHALASYAVGHRWLVALEVPALLRQTGEQAPFAAELAPVSDGVALGDPRFTLRGRVLGSTDGAALGVGARVSIPLSTSEYAGSPGPVVHPFVSFGHQTAAAFSAINLGFEWRRSQMLPGLLPTRVGSSLQLVVASGVALDRARSTRLGPELSLNVAVTNGAGWFDPRSTDFQFLVHLQHRLRGGPFELGAAFGPTLGRAPGAAEYRGLLSVTFSPEAPVPPSDTDEDRVADDNDMCPSIAGEASEDPLMNGCPPIPSDADGDGIPDTLDACPRTVGEPSLVRKRHGCPKPLDRDHDTIVDPDDACPDEPGVTSEDPSLRGCPPPPPPPTVQLDQAQITISEQVQFEVGTAVIRDESSALLAQVVAVLQAHPEVASCEVAGHTDDTGTGELNRQLSEARARAVMSWLVAHGVDARRLSARGYGQTRPIADNASEEGRAKNRRVEFLILRRAAPTKTESR
jgi:OmpA-OmpF porin, OOP family